MAQYLNEIRLGKQKQVFRDIIEDVRKEYNLPSRKRPVPHITLFGPYDANQGFKVKQRTQDVLSSYSVVPFTVSGFDSFEDTNVVYADIVPSNRLQSLRRRLAGSLEPITYNQRAWDLNNTFEFHITIATNLGDQTSSVLQYVKDEHQVEMELHATRFTALDRRRMMWEWDLPRGVELSSQEATSKESWQQTMQALEQERKQSNEGIFSRLVQLLTTDGN